MRRSVMESVNRWLIAHRSAVRFAWLAVLLFLAACNEGDGDGGGPY